MVKIVIKVDDMETRIAYKGHNKRSLIGPLLLALCVDAVRSFGIELDEEFVHDYLSLSLPEGSEGGDDGGE